MTNREQQIIEYLWDKVFELTKENEQLVHHYATEMERVGKLGSYLAGIHEPEIIAGRYCTEVAIELIKRYRKERIGVVER